MRLHLSFLYNFHFGLLPVTLIIFIFLTYICSSYVSLLEDDYRKENLLLDRLLKKNIDDFKYIIDEIKKKVKWLMIIKILWILRIKIILKKMKYPKY